MIAAIVPAAGMSTRMGRNKLLLTFRQKPLIAHSIDTLLASEVAGIVVVLGHEAEKVRAEIGDRKVTIVENPCYRDGMSTSIRAGMAVISPRFEAVMVCLPDQPLIEASEINRLIHAFSEARDLGKSIVVPFFRGQRGNPVIMGSVHREAILKITGDAGCRGIVGQNPACVHMIEMDTDHVVRDIDGIEDYAALR